jgi:transposase
LPEDSLRWKRIGQELDENHHAKIVERQVDMLDRAVVDQAYRGSGSRPYDPMVMLKMVLYQYLKGNQSPAVWHEEARFNRAMQWLGRGWTKRLRRGIGERLLMGLGLVVGSSNT